MDWVELVRVLCFALAGCAVGLSVNLLASRKFRPRLPKNTPKWQVWVLTKDNIEQCIGTVSGKTEDEARNEACTLVVNYFWRTGQTTAATMYRYRVELARGN